MNIDQIITEEFSLYLKRYQAWQDSEQTDTTAEMMTTESERILKQCYRLKFNEEPTSISWASFMADLGSKIKL